MIDVIYNKKTQKINWSIVWNIPEFKVLLNTKQSTKWHKEGVVANHTIMVVNEMEKQLKSISDEEYKMIMLLGALFHDIGKGETTFFNNEKNDWSATNHSEVGEQITRRLLWNEKPIIRESVCYLVRNHMKPLYICENPVGIREIIKMSCDGIYPKYCNFKNLILLKTCDCLGSIFDENDEWEEKLEFAKALSIELDCFDKPYKFSNVLTKYNYFNLSADIYPSSKTVDDTKFTSFVTLGISEDLKNKIISENCDITVITNEDKNYDFIDQIIECCEDNKTFIIDLSLLPQDSWNTLFTMVYSYKGLINIIYGSEELHDYVSPTFAMSYVTAN